MQMVRQGDVMLVRVGKLDLEDMKQNGSKVKPEAHENGNSVLAHGEVTGHSHKVDGQVSMIYSVDGERYLRVSTDSNLTHEEHGSIPVPAGDYKVVQQKEYTPAAPVPVRD
jgi:hypothetical protein